VNRSRAGTVSLALGLAAAAGVFALGRTLALGHEARAARDGTVAARAAQLDRYEASLRRALAQKPPPLPAVPAARQATPSQAPVRIVYHRPPAVVVTRHRSGEDGGGEREVEGAGADD
jgi:hypothetical protein